MHVVLVSNQPVPSLAPLIDPALEVEEVLLVHAGERQRHARRLADALARHGIEAHLYPLADGYDLPTLRAEFAALAGRHPEGVIANLTGGSKLMTLAAWETFARPVDRLYYVDIRRDTLKWLRPQAPAQPIADRLRLETFLAAHGFLVPETRPPRRDSPDRHLLEQARQLAVRIARQGGKYHSPGGKWLEELVFAEAQALLAGDGKAQDLARQVVVVDDGPKETQALNEIDVAILRDNTLFVIECKTGQSGRKGAASDALYKLALLTGAAGGLRGCGVFVTTEQLSAPLMGRARLLGIDVIDRAALCKLGQALANILSRRSPAAP